MAVRERTPFTRVRMDTPSERALIVFVVTSALSVAMLGFARWVLVASPERSQRFVPAVLLHTWSAGAIGLGSIYVFFVLPFLLAGLFANALAGFAFASVVVALAGRDVLGRVWDDVARHRAERRGPAAHRTHCRAHHTHLVGGKTVR